MLPAPPPPYPPVDRVRLRDLRRQAGPVGAARDAAQSLATGPPRDILTAGGRFWAVPVFRGWVAIDPVPAGGPIAWRFHAYGPTYRNWVSVATAREAAARAGYGVRGVEGVACRFTVSRVLHATWTAFLDALDLEQGDHCRAALALAGEVATLVEGFLAGTTPAGVVMDYLAECGPPDARDGFARLAAGMG